jgi:peptide/nickel transport system permease protein
MIRFLVKRLFFGMITLFSVVTIVFWLFHFAFPSPEQMLVGQRTDEKTLLTIKKDLGLDKSAGLRYRLFLKDISPVVTAYDSESFERYEQKKVLNLGLFKLAFKLPYFRNSFKYKQNATDLLFQAFQGTLLLSGVSIILALFIGIILGIIASLNFQSAIDRFIQFVSTIGISVPSFFSAIIISWLLGYILHSYTGLNMTGSWFDIHPTKGKIWTMHNLILPAFALSIRPVAIFAMLTRNSMLEVLRSDYIKTAISKGLTNTQIIRKHALPNALNPVITSATGWFASMLAGAFFVEYIFNWKGIGKITIEALEHNDLPLIMGALMLIASIFIIINIFVDLLYSYLDPRIKIS